MNNKYVPSLGRRGRSATPICLLHPVDALLTIPSALTNWELFSLKRDIEGTLKLEHRIITLQIRDGSAHHSPNVVEIGVYQGLSTIYLAYASRKKGKKS